MIPHTMLNFHCSFSSEKVDPRLNSVIVEELMIPKKKDKMSDDESKRKKKEKRKNKKKQKRKNKNNRFRKNKRTKHDPSLGPAINCKVTEWSDWSRCSVTCGRGLVTKSRKVITKDSNGGKPCPRKLMRKKKCKSPKCRKYFSFPIIKWFEGLCQFCRFIAFEL